MLVLSQPWCESDYMVDTHSNAVEAPDSRPYPQQCAYCYKQPGTEACTELRHCPKCHKRRLCSRECQLADWKSGHKHWCGKTGEIGHDFEVREAPGKSLGVFALRDFEPNEKIMMERPVASVAKYEGPVSVLGSVLSLDDSRKQAVQALTPAQLEKTPPALAEERELPPEQQVIAEKIRRNGMGTHGGGNGLYILMSRINHSCIHNCSTPTVDKKRCVKVVSATRRISQGDEITISYCSEVYQRRSFQLHLVYGFECTCAACADPVCRQEYDDDLVALRRIPALIDSQEEERVLEAIIIARQLLHSREVDGNTEHCCSLCGELYRALAQDPDTLEEARQYAARGADIWEAFTGVCDDLVSHLRALAAG